MRPAALVGFVLAAVPAAGAEPAPYLAVVADTQALLRAGPSDKFPETGTVARGARVRVDHEEPNGWLAVDVPREAVSWVPMQFIEGFNPERPTPYAVSVSLSSDAEITLAAGKVGVTQPLEVRRTKVPNGTVLTVIGPPAKFDGKTWYPVTPPPGDFRYVPKAALQFEQPQPANTSFVVRDTAPPGLVTPTGATAPGPAATAPKPVADHPLLAQAEAAEREGRLDDAEKLYFQLARVMNEPGGDHDVANLCYTRIHSLREKRRTGANAPASPPGPTAGARPAGIRQNGTRTDVARPDAVTPARSREDRPALLPPVRDDRAVSPVSRDVPAAPPAARDVPATTPPPADERPQWTGAGKLVRTPAVLDGRQTYALESAPGIPRVYVVGGPGVDLKPYLNRTVDVFGVAAPYKGLSKPYVVATDVNPNP